MMFIKKTAVQYGLTTEDNVEELKNLYGYLKEMPHFNSKEYYKDLKDEEGRFSYILVKKLVLEILNRDKEDMDLISSAVSFLLWQQLNSHHRGKRYPY